MKEKLSKIYSQCEQLKPSEMEDLMDELKYLLVDMQDNECEDCGHWSGSGACFYCKMD